MADEAQGGFLTAYNDAAEAMRQVFPYLPIPALSIVLWLSVTIGLVALLTALAPLAFRGARGMEGAMVGLACLAFANVAGHVSGSVLAGRLIAGTYSTPLLAAAGVYGITVAWRRGRFRARGQRLA